MAEKRKHARFGGPFHVKLRHPDSKEIFSGVMENVSFEGGCIFLDTSDSLSVGQVVLLSVFLTRSTLNVDAKIVWQKKDSDKNRIGVAFINLPDSLKDEIYRSVFENNPKEITKKWWDD